MVIAAGTGQLSEKALRAADEVFITATAGGIMAVTRIDAGAIGGGRVGPVSSRPTELCRGMHRDPHWPSPVACLSRTLGERESTSSEGDETR